MKSTTPTFGPLATIAAYQLATYRLVVLLLPGDGETSVRRSPVKRQRKHPKTGETMMPSTTSSLAAAKRLRKELQVLKQQAKQQAQKQQQDQQIVDAVDDDILLQVNPDNLLLWKGWIRGPVDTPYEGGVFQLDIRCGMDYPLAPPTIRFVTKVSQKKVIVL